MIKYRGVDILHCDNHVLVAVKPPNIPSQRDISGDPDMLTLMRAYVKEAYGKPGEAYLGLVHRLDRPVGGLMAFARTSKAAARLSEQVRAREMEKTYLAIVRGDAEAEAKLVGTIQRSNGTEQDAELSYRLLDSREGLSLLSVRLKTGRKHQIRIQLSRERLPIWGDARYGAGKPGEQIALWAERLSFAHPTKKERMTFQALPPPRVPWIYFSETIGLEG